MVSCYFWVPLEVPVDKRRCGLGVSDMENMCPRTYYHGNVPFVSTHQHPKNRLSVPFGARRETLHSRGPTFQNFSAPLRIDFFPPCSAASQTDKGNFFMI